MEILILILENLIPLLAQVVRENVELRLIFDVSGRLASNSFESEELEKFDERIEWLSMSVTHISNSPHTFVFLILEYCVISDHYPHIMYQEYFGQI